MTGQASVTLRRSTAWSALWWSIRAGLRNDIEQRITDAFQHQIRSMILTVMGAVVLLLLADALRSIV
jgi:hypothetical protein